MSINEYAQLAVSNGARCFGGCNKLLKVDQIQNYEHDGGWKVTEHKKRQWLYFECDDCHYGTSLTKLGIPPKGK